MTAYTNQPDPQPGDSRPSDPIGPITLPVRSKIGARAMALVGTAGLAGLAFHALMDGCSTPTSITVN